MKSDQRKECVSGYGGGIIGKRGKLIFANTSVKVEVFL